MIRSAPGFIPALVSTLFLTACGGAASAPVAPAFSLQDIHGEIHTLAQYAGRIVVLEWTNYDCPFVVKHYGSQNMQGLQRKYATGDTGVVWLQINSSAPDKQGHFTTAEWKTRSAEWNVAATAILLDPTGATGKAYGATNTPHMYVIDPGGALVYQGAIDSIRTPDPEDIAKAENLVAPVIDHLLAGHAVTPQSNPAYGCGVKYAE